MSEDTHSHTFDLWDERTRSYQCECGASWTESAMEAQAPAMTATFRYRIAELEKELESIHADHGEGTWLEVCEERDGLRAEVNRLREAIECIDGYCSVMKEEPGGAGVVGEDVHAITREILGSGFTNEES